MAQIDWTVVKVLGLPRVGQLGFIVDDAAEALPAYATIYGISTWYRTFFTRNAVQYGDRYYEADWDFVHSYSGQVQMELIDLGGDKENIFGEFLDQHGPGLQHLGFYLRDLDEKVAQAQKAGIEVLQTGDLRLKSGSKGRAVFLDARPTCGLVLELIELKMGRFHLPSARWLMEVSVLTGNGQRIRPLQG